MLRSILAGIIGRFERTWNYDAGYMRFIANAAPVTFLKFSFITTAADRTAAPAAALAAAGIVATIAEDCGPCTQISADMAARSGVQPEVLRAILAGDESAMGADAALAWRATWRPSNPCVRRSCGAGASGVWCRWRSRSPAVGCTRR